MLVEMYLEAMGAPPTIIPWMGTAVALISSQGLLGICESVICCSSAGSAAIRKGFGKTVPDGLEKFKAGEFLFAFH